MNLHFLASAKKVESGSAADLAGLKKGDMLLQMNNQNFETMTYDTAINTLRRNTDMKVLFLILKDDEWKGICI